MQHASLHELNELVQRRKVLTQNHPITQSHNHELGKEPKSERNSALRDQAWLLRQPGSRGPVPGRGLHSFAFQLNLSRV